MIIEVLVWLLFTIFIVWLSAVKVKHFMKDRKYRHATIDLEDIKNKPSQTKTLDDKKDFLRQKTATGGDLMSVVISMILFMIGFTILIYPRIPNLYDGLIIAFIFAIIFSYVSALIQFPKEIRGFKFIDGFIGYLFASTFMVYIRFISSIYPLLLLVMSIALMVYSNNIINKWVGNDNIKR